MLFKFGRAATRKGKTIKKRESTSIPIITPTPSPDNGVQGNNEGPGEKQENAVTLAEFFKQDTVEYRKEKYDEGKKTPGGRTIPEPHFATLPNNGSVRATETSIEKTETTGPTKDTTSNSQPPHIASITSSDEAATHHPSRSHIPLLLGTQDPHSPYLTHRYFPLPSSFPLFPSPNPFTSPSNQTTPLHLPSLDPHAFALYNIYTHTGTISTHYVTSHYPSTPLPLSYIWQAHWPLINAHILGCMIEEPEFADRVMDVLAEKLKGVRPDAETIEHLFGEGREHMSKVLRRFVVERWVDGGLEGVDREKLPTEFVGMALESAMRRLGRGRRRATRGGCEFHIHERPEDCYTARVSPAYARKERRLERDREVSRKDSEEVIANARQNGVKSVDWEARDMDVRRDLAKQTGKSWIGFARLNGGDSTTLPASQSPPDIDCHKSKGPSTTSKTNMKPLDIPSTQSQTPPMPLDAPALNTTTPTDIPTPLAPIELEGNPIPPHTSPPSSQSPASYTTSPFISNPATHSSTNHPTTADTSVDLPPPPKYEQHIRCPGAFPVSRVGSAKSVAYVSPVTNL